MGCSASKNITVEPQDIEKNGDGPISNGYHRDDEKIRQEPLQASSLIESEEPPPEVLENPVVNNLQKKVSGLSFELAFEDDKEESIIKKHPPKRFQTLEDRPSTPVTLEKLQEKLEEAEIRRQQENENVKEQLISQQGSSQLSNELTAGLNVLAESNGEMKQLIKSMEINIKNLKKELDIAKSGNSVQNQRLLDESDKLHSQKMNEKETTILELTAQNSERLRLELKKENVSLKAVNANIQKQLDELGSSKKQDSEFTETLNKGENASSLLNIEDSQILQLKPLYESLASLLVKSDKND
ncbi:hypothetical protein HHI36_013271 [Cryptolaemus montrouzieri]|uniref:Uncharacterized protein n=1 Tax=Cryptolaemus montrouzieri TaxID=559131 RepID=A0ABD2NH93_9CUCU